MQYIMGNPMILWYAIVILVVIAVMVHLIHYLIDQRHRADHAPSVFGMMKEREMFYIPGDARTDDEEDDFEDL